MAKITRKKQKVFADSASTNLGQFGSAAAGTKITSSDPDVLQALSAFEGGWYDATVAGSNLPTIEETNTLAYLATRQIAYIFQEGIAEYDSTTTYYQNSIVKESGTTKVYKSLTNDNVGNALTDVVNWSLLGDLSNLPSAPLGTAAFVNTGTASGNVPLVGTASATTSLAGTAPLATLAEVQTGTATGKIIDPATLAGAMANSKTTNGYTYLPNGIIMQWGLSNSSNNPTNVTFPIAFPNICLSLQLTAIGIVASGTICPAIYLGGSPTTTGFSYDNRNGQTGLHTTADTLWFAIGY